MKQPIDRKVKNQPSRSPEYRHEYYLSHKLEHSARTRLWYQANKEKVRLLGIQYRKENSEKLRIKKAEYRRRNRKILAEKQLARYYSRYDEHRRKLSAYRNKNRDRIRSRSRNRSLEITDGYAREMLSKYSLVSAKDWPQALVEAKRMELLCMRLTGDKRYKSADAAVASGATERDNFASIAGSESAK